MGKKYSILVLLLTGCGSIKQDSRESFDCMLYGEDCHAESRIGDRGPQSNPGIPGPVGTGTQGPAGERGEQGAAGSDGKDCTVNQTPTGAEITCTDGTSATVNHGTDGQDGSSCTSTQTSNGAIISCTDGTSVVLLNGTNGADGANGQDGQDAPPTAYSVVEVKDPCGDQSGFDEVLLRMANGQWIAHFSGSGNNFLTILSPGNYQTTDQTRCRFTLNSSGQIVNEYNY